ncbi:CRISPR-associated helicase Cas3' [Candidatus Caldatribacterium saccharofermentans]|uniref:CRISPR-associated helicase Cas3' n=1 Tax=Candidatus Caldatribacterium saccharofermentans TaxID=1454753 RepID=UPI003D024E07
MTQRYFQHEVLRKLSAGQSVLVVAPTGLGKTRAALEPFLRASVNGGLLGTRLIYALPLRALTKGVVEEFNELRAGLRPIVHHGDAPESRFFSERAIVTTIDQYFTAFAGAPLSWASHLSHAAAGAVLTSYSVFDEVHLLSPQKGLHLLFAALYLRKRWGLLSCVMTATLPPSVVEFFENFCRLEKVEATDEDIQERDSWRQVRLELMGRLANSKAKGKKKEAQAITFEWDEKTPTELAEFVFEKWNQWNELGIDGSRKIIVFVNTVDRALQVYRELKSRPNVNVLLAHSRFTKEHREKIEAELHRFFGKNSGPEEAILVTTQVAEAGLNISAPLVITELCPMDSLIQRAGRCQRFRPSNGRASCGKILVVKPAGDDWYLPYADKVRLVRVGKEDNKEKRELSEQFFAIEFTRAVLEQRAGKDLRLRWEEERHLVEQALNRLYQSFLKGSVDVEFQKGEEFFETLFNRHFNRHKGKQREAEEEESDEE